MNVPVNIKIVTPTDEAVKRIGYSIADILCAIQAADTVDECMAIHERGLLLVDLCEDVSKAALRRAALVGTR